MRNWPRVVLVGTFIMQIMAPPGSTYFGPQLYSLVFLPENDANSVGLSIGNACVFTRKSASFVACVVMFVPATMSTHCAPVTKTHEEGTTLLGTAM